METGRKTLRDTLRDSGDFELSAQIREAFSAGDKQLLGAIAREVSSRIEKHRVKGVELEHLYEEIQNALMRSGAGD